MKRFADDTHFHGVKELYYAPKLFKLFWICLIIASTGLCIYETYKVIEEYVEAQPVTQISSQAPLKFPPAMFCPPDWTNESAIEASGFTEQSLMYGLGFLAGFSSQIKAEHPLFKALVANLTAIKNEFNELLKKQFQNEVDEFVKRISITASSIKCENCVNGTPRPRITPYGTCYLMEFDQLKDPFLQYGYQFYYIPEKRSDFAKKHGWTQGYIAKNENQSAQLYVGNAVSEYMPLDYITLQFDEPLRIRYSAALHKRLNTRSHPCFEVDEKNLDNSTTRDNFRHCQSICAMELNEGCESNKCQIWMPYKRFQRNLTKARYCDFRDNIEASCNKLDESENEKIIEKSQQCLQSCKPLCTEWTFSYSKDIDIGLYYRKELENVEQGKFFAASFTFVNPLGSMVFAQKEGYSLDSLVSNVGGQLGLWLGASVISFFQAIYLFYISDTKTLQRNTEFAETK